LATSDEEAILEVVKAKPYYSVRFLPASPMDLSFERTTELVQSSAVRLRGWDFPHYDPNAVVRDQRYIGVQVNWANHVEMWRMFRSGQFVYFGAPWDLAMDNQERLMREFQHVMVPDPSQRESVPGVLSFVGMIYSVTEFYLFAARLAQALETSGIIFELGLKNVQGWALVAGEVAVPWHSFYQCRTRTIQLRERDYDRLVSDPVADAAAGLREIFSCFGWDNTAGAITSWQERFMAGRFAF
jgi:hypothetical protein